MATAADSRNQTLDTYRQVTQTLAETKHEEMKSSHYGSIDPAAIAALREKLNSAKLPDAARLSKGYIKETLGIDIGDRGGIVIMKNPGDKEHSIWEVEKEYKADKKLKSIRMGRGSMAKIKSLINVKTGEKKLIKILSPLIPIDSSQAKTGLRREAAILADLKKGDAFYIEKLYTAREKANLKKKNRPCIAMNYVPTIDLSTALADGKIKLSLAEKFKAIKSLCRKVAWIHEQGYVHMDISANNVRLDEKNAELDVIDVGFSQKIGDSIAEAPGTPGYAAPEAFKMGQKAYPERDIFSVGNIARALFELLLINPCTNAPLFNPMRFDLTQQQSLAILAIIHQMTVDQPEKRISLKEAINQFDALEERIAEPTLASPAEDKEINPAMQLALHLARDIRIWIKNLTLFLHSNKAMEAHKKEMIGLSAELVGLLEDKVHLSLHTEHVKQYLNVILPHYIRGGILVGIDLTLKRWLGLLDQMQQTKEASLSSNNTSAPVALNTCQPQRKFANS